MAFQNYTVKTVILPLQKKLQENVGMVYPTKGSFYREIEVLKFPYLSKRPSNKNVYSSTQYDSILNYFVEQGLIEISDNPKRKGAYIVTVTNPLNCPVTEKTQVTLKVNNITETFDQPIALTPLASATRTTQVTVSLSPDRNLILTEIGPYAFELAKEAGDKLTARELQVLNQNGFVFHSCQTDIENEHKHGVNYVDIYYFSQITFTESFFAFFNK